MQEKNPGQGDVGGDKKQWPGDETGKQGGQGDVGKKGGSGEVDRGGGQGGQTGGQPDEKKLQMQPKDLPKRPGEYGPDDVGKKGGAPVENPNIEGPTDIPDKGGDVRQPPA